MPKKSGNDLEDSLLDNDVPTPVETKTNISEFSEIKHGTFEEKFKAQQAQVTGRDKVTTPPSSSNRWFGSFGKKTVTNSEEPLVDTNHKPK